MWTALHYYIVSILDGIVLLGIITKHDFLIKESALLYQIYWLCVYEQITLRNNGRVNDWTVEGAIIASNENCRELGFPSQ